MCDSPSKSNSIELRGVYILTPGNRMHLRGLAALRGHRYEDSAVNCRSSVYVPLCMYAPTPRAHVYICCIRTHNNDTSACERASLSLARGAFEAAAAAAAGI